MREFGVTGAEIRTVGGKPPQALSSAEAASLRQTLEGNGLRVSAIASPILKCQLGNEAELREHLGFLRNCLRLARELDTKLIRVFTFWKRERTEEVWNQVVRGFRKLVPLAEEAGVTLAVENEHACHVGTGRQLARLLADINSPHVRAVWDPANEVCDEDGERTYPDAYQRIKGQIVHVHVKDAGPGADGKPRCLRLGDGIIDWKGQLAALKEDGFSGFVSLETHWRPQALSEELLSRPGGEAFSEAGEQATYLCLRNLMGLLPEGAR